MAASPANGSNTHYVARFDSTDAGAYDTLNLTMRISTNNQNNTRFGGTVLANVVAVPEPGAALLGGLGLLGMMRRRRG